MRLLPFYGVVRDWLGLHEPPTLNLTAPTDRLIGYYSILGDRLAGSVQESPFAGGEILTIFVTRGGTVIASTQAEPTGDWGGFRFTLPIEGRFSRAEILNEAVLVTVRNKKGESGVMRLDGAAQLELIREHHGVPAEPVIDLDFADGGNARPYLRAGWSNAEREFTWTEDDESVLSFDAPSKPGTYALRLTAGAFLPKPKIEQQNMQILVNDQLAAMITMTEAHMQFNEATLSGDLLIERSFTTLRFLHPDAARPSDFYPDSDDRRRLAFSVRRLSVVRLLPLEV